MKRSSLEVAGVPRLRDPRPAVAGRPGRLEAVEVFSTASVMSEPSAFAPEETEILIDFADFMGGLEEADAAPVPSADPSFRDRLRRRLWRIFVNGSLRGGGRSTH